MLQVLSIEELTAKQIQRAEEFLTENTKKGPIEGIYWLIIPENYLTVEQKPLLKGFGPFKVAIEILKDRIRFELLVRSESVDNFGGGNLTNDQNKFLLDFYLNLYSWLSV
jgi:hypothetical protein